MKKKVFIVVCLLIILVLGFLFYFFSQPSSKNLSEEEKKEALSQLLGREVNLENDTPQGNTKFEGKTITFSYPAKAVIYEFRERSTNKNSNDLDDFSFDIKNPRLVFNFKASPSDSIKTLTDVPAVNLRELRGGEYKKETVSLDGVKGVAYKKSADDPEINAFYLGGGRLYTISITGVTYEEAQKLFDLVTSTAKFK